MCQIIQIGLLLISTEAKKLNHKPWVHQEPAYNLVNIRQAPAPKLMNISSEQ